MSENKQIQRKKLNVKAIPFDANNYQVSITLDSTQIQQNKDMLKPQSQEQKNNMTKDHVKNKSKQNKKILQNNHISQKLKDEYIINKKEDQNKEMQELLNLQQIQQEQKKYQQSNRQQTKQQVQKNKDSDSEDEPRFDPKYGYWHYMHDDFLKLLNKKKQKLEKKLAQQAENERLLQEKRLIQLQRKKKKYERHLRLTRTLGIKHIGTIIQNLKMQRGQTNQKIIRNDKKIKKPSKIKQTQKVYSENFGQDIMRVIDDQKNQSALQENPILEQSEYVTEVDSEEEVQENSDSQITLRGTFKINVAETIFKLQTENPYSQEKYNNMRIRGWVNHLLSTELDAKVLSLINALAVTQAHKKIQDPKKFKKRIVAGFHEVKRTLTTILEVKQSKLIILAINNIENPLPDGTDFQILQIIKLCIDNKIPFINASNRRKLGWAFRGKLGIKISVISIINYQGYNDQFQDIMENLEKLTQQFTLKYQFDLKQYIQ